MTRAGEADATPADNKFAMGTFAFSIFYLFAIYAALLVEHLFGLTLPVSELLA